jgi:colicin import membrane protein
MTSTQHRIEFAPPAQPASVRALALAIFAHLLLLGALTWGVNWKSQDALTTAEAELWASVPQQAAPKAVEPPPAAPEKPTPKARAPEPEPAKAPDIVQERDKPPPKKAVEKPPEKPVEKPTPPAKAVDAAAQKREAQKKAAEQEAAQLAAQREENLKRMTGMAGATGGPAATGTALQSAGPSSGYGGRIKARVKPNLVFTSTVSGNPKVTIEVRMAPDGTILGRPRVVKSSGNSEWDEAVVRAFEKTEVLPRDADGRVHSPLVVDWRVND